MTTAVRRSPETTLGFIVIEGRQVEPACTQGYGGMGRGETPAPAGAAIQGRKGKSKRRRGATEQRGPERDRGMFVET